MVCLDTDVIINALRNRADMGEKIIELKGRGIPLFTTAINTFELFKGVREETKEKELSSINNFLSGVELLDLNFESSKKAAEIFNSLKSQGQMVDFADVMISSIAITNNQPILTQNKKHFEKIKELNFYD